MRLDSWLWTTRFFSSRSQATAACRAGRVRVNGQVAKAAAAVAIGDRVAWRDAVRLREVVVVALLARRVGPAEAALAYTDHSAPAPAPADRGGLPQRDAHTGRPEKRQRRQTDRLRGYQK
jgi:ribosome-associated heat shock protein Hsp15